MTCAPPPPIGTMLCSKEPPPSRPTPQPAEGCFQFETDYAGNVGNDMGVPTAGYRAGRFNLPEWHEATYAKYYQSFADRDNAERLRNVSTDMIKETSALARLTQVTSLSCNTSIARRGGRGAHWPISSAIGIIVVSSSHCQNKANSSRLGSRHR